MEADEGVAAANDGVAHVEWDPSYLPQFYSGKQGDDFDTWCRKIELAVQNYAHGAPELHHALASRLDGPVFEFWDQLPEDIKNNFQQSKLAISEVFGKNAQRRKVREFTFTRTKTDKESFEMYAASIFKTVNSAFVGVHNYGEVFKQREVLRLFIKGLPAPLQMKCMEQGPQTLQEAMNIVKRIERAKEFAEMQQGNIPKTESTVSGIDMHVDSKVNTEVEQLISMVKDLTTEVKEVKAIQNKGRDRSIDLPYHRSNWDRFEGQKPYVQSKRVQFPMNNPEFEMERRGRPRDRCESRSNVHSSSRSFERRHRSPDYGDRYRYDSYSPSRYQRETSRERDHSYSLDGARKYTFQSPSRGRNSQNEYCTNCSGRMQRNRVLSRSPSRNFSNRSRSNFGSRERYDLGHDRCGSAPYLNAQRSEMWIGPRSNLKR